jgi:type IV secretion system protein VirD4
LYSTKGQSSSYAVSYQLKGRELLTPDEVRLLDNKYALLFIRGERPIKDLKFDIMKHKNTVYTPDGNGKPYVHKDTIELDTKDNFERYQTKDDEIEVLSNQNF